MGGLPKTTPSSRLYSPTREKEEFKEAPETDAAGSKTHRKRGSIVGGRTLSPDPVKQRRDTLTKTPVVQSSEK